jgi:hypothetical protein
VEASALFAKANSPEARDAFNIGPYATWTTFAPRPDASLTAAKVVVTSLIATLVNPTEICWCVNLTEICWCVNLTEICWAPGVF